MALRGWYIYIKVSGEKHIIWVRPLKNWRLLTQLIIFPDFWSKILKIARPVNYSYLSPCIKGGMGHPPRRKEKWLKSAIFRHFFSYLFFPLRYAFCPLDTPTKNFWCRHCQCQSLVNSWLWNNICLLTSDNSSVFEYWSRGRISHRINHGYFELCRNRILCGWVPKSYKSSRDSETLMVGSVFLGIMMMFIILGSKVIQR